MRSASVTRANVDGDEGCLPDAVALNGVLGSLGSLIDLVGDGRLPVYLAAFLHDRLAAQQVHIARIPKYRPDCIISASHDGSDAAFQQTRLFFDRRLYRFERPTLTSDVPSDVPLTLENDHTQSWGSPQFRSFGREVDVGARFVIRKADPDGDITIVMHWPLQFGAIDRLRSDITAMSTVIAPIVGRHVAMCEAGDRLLDRVRSATVVEQDLLRLLGSKRRREVEVGARLVAGATAESIGLSLGVGTETVVSHRKRLYERLGVSNVRELLLWYLSNTANGVAPPVLKSDVRPRSS